MILLDASNLVLVFGIDGDGDDVEADVDANVNADDVDCIVVLLAVAWLASASGSTGEVLFCEFESAFLLLCPPPLFVDVVVSSSDNDKSYTLISLFSSIE
jgi:hypothetical protein